MGLSLTVHELGL